MKTKMYNAPETAVVEIFSSVILSVSVDKNPQDNMSGDAPARRFSPTPGLGTN